MFAPLTEMTVKSVVNVPLADFRISYPSGLPSDWSAGVCTGDQLSFSPPREFVMEKFCGVGDGRERFTIGVSLLFQF
jgi:hypothetical protein